MHAADVMTPDVICAGPDTSLAELVRLMLDNDVSGVPIIEDGRVVGIVSEGDLLRRAELGIETWPLRWLELLTSSDRLAADYAKSHGRKASEIMTRDVVTVDVAAPITDVAHLLEARHIKRVPVTRDGRLVGIVTRRNLLQALATSLAVPPADADDRTIRDAFYAELQRQAWATPSPAAGRGGLAMGAASPIVSLHTKGIVYAALAPFADRCHCCRHCPAAALSRPSSARHPHRRDE
jgi:CBS domain-containing protein